MNIGRPLALLLFTACSAAPALPCLTSGDCASGETCVSHQCLTVSPGQFEERAEPTRPIDPVDGLDAEAPSASFDPMAAALVPSCAADVECAPPVAICDARICKPGCATGGGIQCGAREVCDTNTGRCVAHVGPCTEDAQCGAPDNVCELGQCVPGCARFGGVQCVGGSTCVAATGRCSGTSACADDLGEDDDTPATARPLTLGTTANLRLCANDPDHFFATLEPGARLNLTLAATDGAASLVLLDPTGAELSRGATSGGLHRLSGTARTAGRHVLVSRLVSDGGRAPGLDYTLDAALTAPASCVPDRHEENDSARAAPRLAPGRHAQLTVCEERGVFDDDFYAVDLRAGETLDARLDFLHREGDIQLTLRDAGGATLVGSWNASDVENLRHTASRDATVYLYVYLEVDRGTRPGNEYTLTLAVSR